MSKLIPLPEPSPDHAAVNALSLAARDASFRADGRPRVLAVVDGAGCSWRSLVWASGYARARGSAAIGVVPYVRSWERLRRAGQTAPYSTNLPEFDMRGAKHEIGALACEHCLDTGIKPYLVEGTATSAHELLRLLRREQPDTVVLGRPDTLAWLATKRLTSSLTKSGIPVVLIP
jgi:LmbE family N-acetylglucosaminyl deacetylase